MKAGWVQARLGGIVGAFCEEHKLGWVFIKGGYTCFLDDPNRMRRPDISFIHRGRLPGEKLPKGYVSLAPDLAVEIVSHHDVLYDVDRRVQEYLQAGVRRVWVVNPDTCTIRIHRPNPDGTILELREDGELTGDDVLPNFRVPLCRIFPPK